MRLGVSIESVIRCRGLMPTRCTLCECHLGSPVREMCKPFCSRTVICSLSGATTLVNRGGAFGFGRFPPIQKFNSAFPTKKRIDCSHKGYAYYCDWHHEDAACPAECVPGYSSRRPWR